MLSWFQIHTSCKTTTLIFITVIPQVPHKSLYYSPGVGTEVCTVYTCKP